MIALIAILATSNALAQYNPNNLPGTFGSSDQHPSFDPTDPSNINDPYKPDSEKDEDGKKLDTTKRKPRKPLESFYFDDSLRTKRIFAWSVNPQFNSIEM